MPGDMGGGMGGGGGGEGGIGAMLKGMGGGGQASGGMDARLLKMLLEQLVNVQGGEFLKSLMGGAGGMGGGVVPGFESDPVAGRMMRERGFMGTPVQLGPNGGWQSTLGGPEIMTRMSGGMGRGLSPGGVGMG